LKIGINARFLTEPYTGIGQYTYNLLLHLSKIDSENDYYLFTPELVDLELPENFHQIRLPEKQYKSASWRKHHWEHTQLPQEMGKFEIDLAHFFYPSNPNKKMKIPIVVTVHDAIPWVLPEYRKKFRSKLYHFYTKRALKKADHIITVSNFSKDEIKRILKIPNDVIRVIYLSSPLQDKMTPPISVPLRRKYLLYIGGYDKRKNVSSLMKAFQKHIGNQYDIDLMLVNSKGKGLEEHITDEYNEKVAGKYVVKPKGKVLFTGPLEPGELTYLYKQAVALVHVSLYEGFNLPLVEAMSQGLPIIAADIPVNHEVTGDHALFVDPTSVDSIGNGIHEFLNQKTLTQKLRKEGLDRSRDFSWEKCAEETLSVYNLYS